MPLTQQQLESIKAANLAKSVAWEAAHFLPGEMVLLSGFCKATRTSNGWICNQSNLSYATLSRWCRAKCNREAINPKNYCYLIVGNVRVHLSVLPPVTERSNHSPWVAECPPYDPTAAPATTNPSVVNAAMQSERQVGVEAAPAGAPNRLDIIDEHLDFLDSVTMGQQKRLKNLEERTESCEEDHHQRIQALQARIDYLEERLLAVAAVAAHISLFKGRIEALEAKA